MSGFVLFWLVFGVVLMLLELVIPGLVMVFLGLAAALVALGLGLGLIEGFMEAMVAWFVSSLGLILALRELALKLAPTGEGYVADLNQPAELYGKVVTVIDEVSHDEGGRIAFEGTSWPAIAEGTPIPKGAKARILGRIEMTYIVEPLSEIERLELD